MITLLPHADGLILPVRAHAGSRTVGVRGIHAGALKVSVTQVAEKGKANEAISEVLCQALDLKASQVSLLSGATNRNKRFLVREITAKELLARIAQALANEAKGDD